MQFPVFLFFLVSALLNPISALQGFTSCTAELCQEKQLCPDSSKNPIATGLPMDNIFPKDPAVTPECTGNGVCHCKIERAPDTMQYRIPYGNEMNCNQACTVTGQEAGTVYEYQGGKYCVCFSVLREKF